MEMTVSELFGLLTAFVVVAGLGVVVASPNSQAVGILNAMSGGFVNMTKAATRQ